MSGLDLLQRLSRNLSHAAWSGATAVQQGAIVAARFIRNTARAHYNVIGQYTAPFETELLGTRPPSPKDLSFLGQAALTLVPVTLLSYLIALTIGPLVYNSLRYFRLAYLRITNLSLLDLPGYSQIRPSKEESDEYQKLVWYRFAYALPGLIVASLLGLISAVAIVIARIPLNSLESLWHHFIEVTDFALEDEDKIKDILFSEEQPNSPRLYLYGVPVNLVSKENRNPWQIYAFGLFGVITGSILGAFLGFPAVIFGRMVLNSYENIKKFALAGMNLVRKEQLDGAFKLDAEPSILRKYILGFPGLILGFLISAPVGLVVGVVDRVVKESYKAAKTLIDKLIQEAFALGKKQEEPSLEQSEVEQDSKKEDSSFFGAPGYAVGAVLGSLSFLAILGGRVIYNSTISAASHFIAFTNFAAHPEAKLFKPIDDSSRSKSEIYIFGGLGVGLGSFFGAFGFGAVGLARIIANSLKTTLSLSATAINWVIHDEEQLKIALKQDLRTDEEIYGLGVFGLVLGTIGAGLGILLALARRTIIESYKSSNEAYEAVANEAKSILADPAEVFLVELELENLNTVSPDNILIEEIEKRKRSFIDQYFLGLPGLVLGFLAGTLGSLSVFLLKILKESYESVKYGFATVTNLGLYTAHKIEPKNDSRSSKRHYFGVLGLVLGGLAGVLGFVILGVGRNSFESAKRLLASSYNEGLEEHKRFQQDWAGDPRHWYFKLFLGFPGIFLSSPFAALTYARIQIGLTTKEFFNAIVNPILPAEESDLGGESTQSAFDKDRSFYQRFILGAVGVLLGVISGVIAFAAIAVLRSLVNSLKSIIPSFSYVTNLAMDSEQQPIENTIDKDTRTNRLKFGFGFAGVIIGGALGLLFGFTTVSLYRIVKESVENVRKLAITGMNLARHDNEQRDDAFDFRTDDYKHRFFLGFPGLILGMVSFLIANLAAGFVRVMVESWKVTKILYFLIADQAREDGFELSSEDQVDSSLLNTEPDEDQVCLEEGYSFEVESESIKPKPNSADRYFFRLPGYLLGVIAGSLGFAGIIVERVWKESKLSAQYMFWASIDKASDADSPVKIKLPRGRKLQYGFGFLGVVAGLIAGGFGFLIVGLARIIKHSVITAKRFSFSVLNLIRFDQLEGSLQDDTRNLPRKRLGMPGYLIGLVPAFFAVGYALGERMVIATIKTTVELFVAITARALSNDGTFRFLMPRFAPRSRADQILFGAPGILAGLVAGVLGFLVVGIGRIILNSYDLGRQVFARVANLGLDEKDAFSFKELEHDKEQSKEAKTILGSPGLVIGLILGGLYLTAIGVDKLANHSFISWRSLSGSIINGSRGLPLFEGMRGDTRTIDQKIFGGLGYIAALATTFPPFAVYFSLKKGVLILALGLGIVCSPFVAIFKAAFGTPRFDNKIDENQVSQAANDTEQRFKNIYSSLSPFGELKENEAVMEKQKGGKGPSSFIRKAFTFNADYTITEEVAEALLEGWRTSKNQAEFFGVDGEFQACLEKVKKQYSNLSCLEHRELETKPREKQIDEIGAFIKDYILSNREKVTVPKGLYSNYEKSWTAIFWGKAVNSNQDEVLANSSSQVLDRII